MLIPSICALLLFAGAIVSLILLVCKLVGFGLAAEMSWFLVPTPFAVAIAFLFLGAHLYARRRDIPGRPSPKKV